MARIAIFCDGTWDTPKMPQPTHVVRLWGKTPNTNAQHTHYFEGVGTGDDTPGFVEKIAMKVGGGLFGWGLNDHIKAAYTTLCEQYEAGDEIFIFGFSRGAYTARSLTGMIRKCGIVADPTAANVDKAFDLYRSRGHAHRPDTLRTLSARRSLSPHAATSQQDLEWRMAHPWDDGGNHHKVQIAYVGVWDTVGALGLPEPILGQIATLWNKKFRFHDTSLTSLVSAARHAVALDERRIFYKPSLWTNLEDTEQGPGLNQGDTSDTRPYQQLWFVGNHAILGGATAKSRGLTEDTLEWIAAGAQQAGLEIDMQTLLDATPDPLSNSAELTRVPWLYTVAGHLLKWRSGPEHPIALSASAAARIKGRRDYRPKSLLRLMPELFGNAPKED
ncbi:DUF2235 domain-containing protein [Sulfitobacter sp. HNIBRBA2951]|uniref:DUF2235 domain-containing protein n=1 Tax=Sulfitobacter aquimarinus TaxID=3158557 RepID=UPI0032DF0B79